MKLAKARTIPTHTQRLRLQRYATSSGSIFATLVWMAITLVLLGTSSPPTGGQDAWWVPVVGHLGLFGVLGFLVSISVAFTLRTVRLLAHVAAVVAIGSFWGLFTELYQTTVPGRSASIEDFLLDFAGSLLGGLTAWIAGVWIDRRMARAR